MMEYLQVTQGLSVETSSRYLSAFFVLLMLGRLCGAGLVERYNYTQLVGLSLAMTGLCLAGALYGPRIAPTLPWKLLLPASGLCMSIVFPTVTASVSRLHPGRSGAVMGLLFACGGAGGAFGPWLVGQVSQILGLSTGLSMTLFMDGLALLALTSIAAVAIGQRHRANLKT
jgi:MFS transporter, FHS family, glucose/mannose:H+ symporter